MSLALLLTITALADPTSAFPRVDDRLDARYVGRLQGDGPVRPVGRRQWSPLRAWVWPDGIVEHLVRTEGREVREVRRFGPTGRPITTARYAGGRPSEVEVHAARRPVTFDTTEWTEHRLGPVRLVLPDPPTETLEALGSEATEDAADDAPLVVETEEWTFRAIFVKGPADPFSEAYRDGLVEACGCVLVDRTTEWIDGVAGARYRVDLPLPHRPQVGEAWAVARRDGVLLATYVAAAPNAGDPLAPLARGRALVALIRWER